MADNTLAADPTTFQIFVGATPPAQGGVATPAPSQVELRAAEAKAEADFAKEEARRSYYQRQKNDQELAGAANVREWLRAGITGGYGGHVNGKLLDKRLPVQILESTAVNAPELDWSRAYADYLDIFRSDGFWPVFGSVIDRKWGMQWPFWRTDAELTLLRSISRIVAGLNPHAAGFVGGGCAYVIGKGMVPKATPKHDDEGPAQLEEDQRLARLVTEEIEAFSERILFPQLQQEIFQQSLIDGEYFLRLFDLGDELDVRGVWPELIRQPPGTSMEEWGYGIHTPADDIWRVLEYHECDFQLGLGEVIPANEIVHFPLFVPGKWTRGIKRGMPLFSHGVQDAFDTAGKLLRNMGEGTAIRQSFAFFRQWDVVDRESATDFIKEDEDYVARRPFNPATTEPVTKATPGRVIDAPAGMKFAELPQNTETASAIEVVDALLRNAVAVLNAPEWLASGNARNMGAYTSSMVAESPFVKRMEQMQEYYAGKFLTILRAALRVAVRAGRLPREALTRVKLTLEHPSLIARDKNQEAQTNTAYVQMKVKSRHQVAQELSLDYEKQRKEIQEEAQEDAEDQQRLAAAGGGMPGGMPGAAPGGAPPDGALPGGMPTPGEPPPAAPPGGAAPPGATPAPAGPTPPPSALAGGVAESIDLRESADLTREALRDACAAIDPEPSPARKASGTYRKGHVVWKGVPIALETGKGQYRSGIGASGKTWRTKLKDAYGYVKRTESDADGDHIDVFLCDDDLGSELVFVVNQLTAAGQFDEHKCVLGVTSAERAKQVYLRNYEPGWRGLGSVAGLTLKQWRDWLDRGDTRVPLIESRAEAVPESELAEPVTAPLAPAGVTSDDFLEAIGRIADAVRAQPIHVAPVINMPAPLPPLPQGAKRVELISEGRGGRLSGFRVVPESAELQEATVRGLTPILSDVTPRGHHGKSAPRDPITHKIVGTEASVATTGGARAAPAPGPGQDGGAGAAPPLPAAVLADIKEPAAQARASSLYQRLVTAVQKASVEVLAHAHQWMPIIMDTADDFSRLSYYKAGDQVLAHTGIPANTMALITSHALGWALAKGKKAVLGESEEPSAEAGGEL